MALGGHIDRCSDKTCGHLRLSYNSCRNRHCPKCQGTAREKWIDAREQDLLPVPYHHLVFTLPPALNRLALYRPRLVYGTLFKVVWSVVRDFGLDKKHLGALTGMIAILHTWGQQLSLHPHLHCIVPGGGITGKGKWMQARGKGKFLFPVKALSVVFRARYMAAIRKEDPELIDQEMGRALMRHHWVVYAKRPFGGPSAVIEYLGRYTHKIAISDHRLQRVDDKVVEFSYKDYRQAGSKKKMVLSLIEFVRRFALHILPKGFTRIRHYGLLSSTRKVKDLAAIRRQLADRPVPVVRAVGGKRKASPFIKERCPNCKQITMQTVLEFDDRGPPDLWLRLLSSQTIAKKKRA